MADVNLTLRPPSRSTPVGLLTTAARSKGVVRSGGATLTRITVLSFEVFTLSEAERSRSATSSEGGRGGEA